MPIRVTFAALFMALTAFAVSCGSTKIRDDGPGSPEVPDGPVAEAEFAALFPALYCQSAARCCEASGNALDSPFCAGVARLIATKLEQQVYDAEIGGTCLRYFAEPSCDKAKSHDKLFGRGGECDGSFVGTAALGASCVFGEECARPAGADVTCQKDVCMAVRRGVPGDTCHASCRDLPPGGNFCSDVGETNALEYVECHESDGLFCSAEQVCSPLVELGGECDYETWCEADAHCSGDVERRCEARVANGAACDSDHPCVEAAYCADRTCQARSPNGAACISNDECQTEFCTYEKCAAVDDVSTLVCGH